MIGVKKIAHATYETPDLDQQIEYYTDILGLDLVAKEKDAAYLASTLDHHSVVLRKGGRSAMRAARLPDRAGRRSRRLREADRGARHQDATRKKDPEPTDRRHGDLRGPEGHRDGGVQARRARRARNSRPRASCRTSSATSRSIRQRRQEGHRVLLRRARLPRVGLDGRLLLVPALRRRPPHHQPDAGPGEPALPHRVRAARLGPHADRLRFPQPQRLQAAVGPGPPRHRPQPVRLSPRAERADHRAVRRSSTR